jgi:hypothetical protein
MQEAAASVCLPAWVLEDWVLEDWVLEDLVEAGSDSKAAGTLDDPVVLGH